MSYLDTGNSYADVDGKRIAYRELSVGRTALPLVMLVHLAANMDNWDPKLVDALARNRHLILMDLPGVGASEGSVEPSLEESAGHAIDILRALGHDRFDPLGLSMGGMIAQEIVRARPQSVRKLILVGTAPRGGIGVERVTSVTFGHMLHAAIRRKDMKRYIFFTNDETGEAAASATFARLDSREPSHQDVPVTAPAFLAQLKAIKRWGKEAEDGLSFVRIPTLIANGNDDAMVPTPNSHTMHEKIDGSKLVLYQHAGHGSLFQYAHEFAHEVDAFLG